MLKTMEKVVNRYIWDEVLREHPLDPNQHAYMEGKSTVTALHEMVAGIEKSMSKREVLVCAFSDIAGAFDFLNYESIEEQAERKHIPRPAVRWIMGLLQSRLIIAQLGEESIIIRPGRGCPQGGVLSPLLWALVVDDLLQIFADDLVLIVQGSDKRAMEAQLQRALDFIVNWCQGKGLKIHPDKTVVVPFTRKRGFDLEPPTVEGTRVRISREVKYLGVLLDSKLNWNKHVDMVLTKAARAFGACKMLFGTKW